MFDTFNYFSRIITKGKFILNIFIVFKKINFIIYKLLSLSSVY